MKYRIDEETFNDLLDICQALIDVTNFEKCYCHVKEETQNARMFISSYNKFIKKERNNKMIYDLIVCWSDGLKDTFSFTSEEAALNAEKGFKKAFGDLVIFTGINKRSISF